MPEKLEMRTKDITGENVEKIASLFPNCVVESLKDGKPVKSIDFDALRQELSDFVVDGPTERYQFTWPDKSKAKLLANSPINMTLRPCPEESVDFDNTRNLYIEGDNLEVLKLLRETYLGKIKMIYIDPPYNTGSDFIYCDNFSITQGKFNQISGDYDVEGNRLVQNTEQNGKFHTNWLNMMYSRLSIAKDFLEENGVIFISIDDHELGNLIKICNEIFSERNQLITLIWNKQHSQQQGIFKKYHEYVLVYAKNAELINNIEGGKGVIEAGAQKKISKSNPESTFDFPAGVRFDAPDGTYVTGTYGDSEKSTVVSGRLIAKDGKTMEPVTISAGWTQKNQMKLFFAGENVVDSKGQKVTEFFFNSAGKLKCTKDRIKITPPSLLREYGMVSEQTSELNKLMGGHYFDNPKPVEMIKDFISWFVNDGEIVMDFFAGSSTTAHSTLSLNVNDFVKRRFIMIQIPAECSENSESYSTEYDNICSIGKQRIRKISEKIKATLSPIDSKNIDLGFRVLKLDSSNMKDVYYSPDQTFQSGLDSLLDNVKEDRKSQDLLFQCMLDLGVELSVPINLMKIDGKDIYDVDNGYLLACFDTDVTESVVAEIAKKKPVFAVMRDSSMNSDSTATNFEQIFKSYSPTTERKVI